MRLILLCLALVVTLSLSYGVAVAGFFGDIFGSDIVKQVGKTALGLGAGLLMGKLQKKTKVPNRAIPATNAGGLGLGSAAIYGGDPASVGLTLLGSLLSNVIYDMQRRR